MDVENLSFSLLLTLPALFTKNNQKHESPTHLDINPPTDLTVNYMFLFRTSIILLFDTCCLHLQTKAQFV